MNKQLARATYLSSIILTLFILLTPYTSQAQSNQDILNQNLNPTAMCNYYRGLPGIKIEKLTNEECVACTVSGEYKTCSRYFYNGDKWCGKITQNATTISDSCVALPNGHNTSDRPFKMFNHDYDKLTPNQEMRVPKGEFYNLKLDDDSTVIACEDSLFYKRDDGWVVMVEGRFRVKWGPFHGPGRCIFNNRLNRKECQGVRTKHLSPYPKGTEIAFAVTKDSTEMSVLSGEVEAGNAAETEFVTVAANESITFSASGHTGKKTFDPAKFDRWWDNVQPTFNFMSMAYIVTGVLGVFALTVLITIIKRKLRGAPTGSSPIAPAATGVNVPKFCPHCGAKLGESKKFCPACGKPIISSETKNIKKRKGFIRPLIFLVGSIVWLGFVADTDEKVVKNSLLIVALEIVIVWSAVLLIIRLYKRWRGKKKDDVQTQKTH